MCYNRLTEHLASDTLVKTHYTYNTTHANTQHTTQPDRDKGMREGGKETREGDKETRPEGDEETREEREEMKAKSTSLIDLGQMEMRRQEKETRRHGDKETRPGGDEEIRQGGKETREGERRDEGYM